MDIITPEMLNGLLKTTPKLQKMLGMANFELLLAFMKRESSSYNRTVSAHQFWLSSVLAKIEIQSEKAHEVVLNSYGNTGVHLRTLTLDTIHVLSPRKLMVIDFCTCGRIDHWGTISFVEQK